ncbi:MAG: TIM barrel protein [Anaerolineae bacterium]|jgi:sugar phosphate isomerase/epimerase|nr:TIM barrel protein [Anaerolineae bacterium]
MRLGGPIFQEYDCPEAWVEVVKAKGYRAAYSPLSVEQHPQSLIESYANAAAKEDIVIAEVGTWCNPLSPDEETRFAAIERCKTGLWLADELGARCCVNIAGSLGERWDGPCALDLTDDAYALIIDSVRQIIDAVNPKRTFYTLEGMPWMYPDSPECYVRMMKDIDRKGFAAHLDPVNWINMPEKYFKNAELLQRSFDLLGDSIRSIHAKDILLKPELTVVLPEVRLGLGGLDYRTFLRCANQLSENTPFMLEHLPAEEDYDLAAEALRSIAKQEGIAL